MYNCRFGYGKKEFEQKERKTFLELNKNVQLNFEKMFNAKDKKIQLTEQYEIQMLYQTERGYREEKNLSEGERRSPVISHLL